MKNSIYYLSERQRTMTIQLYQDYIKDPANKTPEQLTEAYAMLSKLTKEKEK